MSGAGTFEFGGGTTNFTTGATCNVSGTLTVDGGTVNFSSGAGITLGTLMESGGTLTGSDTVTVSGQTTWTYGTMSGTGTTVADGGLAITVSSDGSVLLDNRTLTNAGIGTLSSSGSNSALEAGDNAIINNLSGATFDVQNSIGINTNYHVPGSATFNNQGTLTKSTGSGTTAISAALNNTGTVSVLSGTLDFYGGGTDSGTDSFSVAGRAPWASMGAPPISTPVLH